MSRRLTKGISRSGEPICRWAIYGHVLQPHGSPTDRGGSDRAGSGDRMRSSPQAEAGYRPPESDLLQQPDANGAYHDDVQDGFNAGGHGDISVDQIQRDSHNDQHDDKVQ